MKRNDKQKEEDLPIISKAYELIAWYVPIINGLPRAHKFTLGDRLTNNLYSVLEELILARYERDKLARLEALNGRLDLIRHQTRLMKEFDLIETNKYGQASKRINEIGSNLGGWIKYQRQVPR